MSCDSQFLKYQQQHKSTYSSLKHHKITVLLTHNTFYHNVK